MKLRKGQAVRIDWDDLGEGAGSYHGNARYIREVKLGQLGDEMLHRGRHVVVKCDDADLGSFFPLAAVLPED